MTFFDFHHHHLQKTNGIYNLNVGESPRNGFFSAGIHPKLSMEVAEQHFDWLHEISKYKNCLAIGECGLDGLIKIDNQEYLIVKEEDILATIN